MTLCNSFPQVPTSYPGCHEASKRRKKSSLLSVLRDKTVYYTCLENLIGNFFHFMTIFFQFWGYILWLLEFSDYVAYHRISLVLPPLFGTISEKWSVDCLIETIAIISIYLTLFIPHLHHRAL